MERFSLSLQGSFHSKCVSTEWFLMSNFLKSEFTWMLWHYFTLMSFQDCMVFFHPCNTRRCFAERASFEISTDAVKRQKQKTIKVVYTRAEWLIKIKLKYCLVWLSIAKAAILLNKKHMHSGTVFICTRAAHEYGVFSVSKQLESIYKEKSFKVFKKKWTINQSMHGTKSQPAFFSLSIILLYLDVQCHNTEEKSCLYLHFIAKFSAKIKAWVGRNKY